jgi:hypothetical protein
MSRWPSLERSSAIEDESLGQPGFCFTPFTTPTQTNTLHLSRSHPMVPSLTRIRSKSKSPRTSFSSNAETQDPLSRALQPPPDESEEDRKQRLQLLRAAEQISRDIDNDIAESKKEWERRKKSIKILLLGTRWPVARCLVTH